MIDMDQNQQAPTAPNQQPPTPAAWTWIAQRRQTDGKAASIWKLGFLAPDGAEVRVTFHQVGSNPDPQPEQPQDPSQPPPADPQADAQAAPPESPQDAPQGDDQGQDGSQPDPSQNIDPSVLSAVNNSLGSGMGGGGAMMGGGMPGATPGQDAPKIPIKGEPTSDESHESTFYITFFSNRNPDWFMKWDTSLNHEDSLTVWVTITHGIVDFVRKASPANVILDDLGNGKLKMVLRSVAMDIVASSPEYEVEQTQKHHYRSFFQIKRKGAPSAFDDSVAGSGVEGETKPLPSPGQPSLAAAGAPADQQQASAPETTEQDYQPFPTSQPVPVTQTPPQQTVAAKKGLTLEIGRDYSVAVKDKAGIAVDRYAGKNPADILRWINAKGYGANKMKIVQNEQPSGMIGEALKKVGKFGGHYKGSHEGVEFELWKTTHHTNTSRPASRENQKAGYQSFASSRKDIAWNWRTADGRIRDGYGSKKQALAHIHDLSSRKSGPWEPKKESFVAQGNIVEMNHLLNPEQAAKMNVMVGAQEVRATESSLLFVFESDRDMRFKQALVELAYNRLAESSDQHPLGTVVSASSGSGFSQKFHTAFKAHDGWRHVNNYRLQGNSPVGEVGQPLDLSSVHVHGVLHQGIGKDNTVDHMFHIAAQPTGTKLDQHSPLSDSHKTYEKQEDGTWMGPEGKPVEHYHFSPKELKLTIKKKGA